MDDDFMTTSRRNQPRANASAEIPALRRAGHFIGLALVSVGVLGFVLNLLFAVASSPDSSSADRTFVRAVICMLLIIVGVVVATISGAGLAGSGVILDPKQARKDLEPFSRQAGGMLKDVIDEAGIDLQQAGAKQVVMIRCRECSKLNEEDSKFCQECGKTI